MKIIVHKTTHIVLFAGGELVLNETEARSDGSEHPQWICPGVTAATAQIFSPVTLPEGFKGGDYTYVPDMFTLSTQGAGKLAAALAAAKAAKNDEINAARSAANLTTFPYSGKLIACDTQSRSDMDGTNGYVANVGALPPGWPGGWKATDNSYVPIGDVAAWRQFYAAMVGQGLLNFAHAQDLKARLAAASTVDAVAAIAW